MLLPLARPILQEHPRFQSDGCWLPSLRKGAEDWTQILDTLSELYVAGLEIDWENFHRDVRRPRVVLPTYPFERKGSGSTGRRPSSAGQSKTPHGEAHRLLPPKSDTVSPRVQALPEATTLTEYSRPRTACASHLRTASAQLRPAIFRAHRCVRLARDVDVARERLAQSKRKRSERRRQRLRPVAGHHERLVFRKTHAFLGSAVKGLISDGRSGTGNSNVFRYPVLSAEFPRVLAESGR